MNKKIAKTTMNRKCYIFVGVALFLALNMLFWFFLLFINLNNRQHLRQEAIKRDQAVQEALITMLNARIDVAIADLLHMSDVFLLYHGDAEEGYEQASDASLIRHWSSISSRKLYYNKVRFFDLNGMEKLRINFDKGQTTLVEAANLQSKSDRYFHQETKNLQKDQIYLSPIDLNMDFGKVEMPFIPTLRLATPVFNHENSRMGTIMINFNLQELLSNYDHIAHTSSNHHYWLNKEGYFLYNSKEPDLCWGFMLDQHEDDTVAVLQPHFWSELNNQGNNFYPYDDEVFIVTDYAFTSNLLPQDSIFAGEKQWYLVAEIDRASPDFILFERDLAILTAMLVLAHKEIIVFVFLLSVVFLIIWILNAINRQKLEIYSYDNLTGALIRHSGLEKLHFDLRKADSDNIVLTICFLDINGLKEVNDNFGHALGDELIKLVSSTINKEIRDSDYLIRMGGDEFLIVFYNADIVKAQNIWKRINDQFDIFNQERMLCNQRQAHDYYSSSDKKTDQELVTFIDDDGQEYCYLRSYLISVSHGFYQLDPGVEHDLEQAIKQADQRMYQQKIKIKKNLQVLNRNSRL